MRLGHTVFQFRERTKQIGVTKVTSVIIVSHRGPRNFRRRRRVYMNWLRLLFVAVLDFSLQGDVVQIERSRR